MRFLTRSTQPDCTSIDASSEWAATVRGPLSDVRRYPERKRAMGDTESAKEWTPAEREAVRKLLKAIEERESQEAQGLMSQNLPEYFLDEVRATAKRCASSRLSDRSLEPDDCDRPRRNQHESTSYVYCWSD